MQLLDHEGEREGGRDLGEEAVTGVGGLRKDIMHNPQQCDYMAWNMMAFVTFYKAARPQPSARPTMFSSSPLLLPVPGLERPTCRRNQTILARAWYRASSSGYWMYHVSACDLYCHSSHLSRSDNAMRTHYTCVGAPMLEGAGQNLLKQQNQCQTAAELVSRHKGGGLEMVSDGLETIGIRTWMPGKLEPQQTA
jgi:hypothetical protein